MASSSMLPVLRRKISSRRISAPACQYSAICSSSPSAAASISAKRPAPWPAVAVAALSSIKPEKCIVGEKSRNREINERNGAHQAASCCFVRRAAGKRHLCREKWQLLKRERLLLCLRPFAGARWRLTNHVPLWHLSARGEIWLYH